MKNVGLKYNYVGCKSLPAVHKGTFMKEIFEYLIKDMPTWKVVLIDKWTDFKVWFYANFLIK